MAYDNPGREDPPMASAGEGKETMDEGMHDESMHEGGGGESSLFLTADMLPSGMKLNAGDILEFKVINPSDADGHIEVVYNTPGKGEGKEESSWEDDFRKEMSPRSEEPSGGDMGGGAGSRGAGGY